MKTIKIPDDMVSKIIDFCDDELNYHINESGCAEQYQGESEAEIFLLRELGQDSMADHYEEQLKEYLEETEEEPVKDSMPYEDIPDKDLVEGFIEEHLEDFVGFDPYEDADGSDYRAARAIVEDYMGTRNDYQIAYLARCIRKDESACYCADGEVMIAGRI